MKRSELIHKIYWLSSFLGLFILAFIASVLFLNPSSVGNQNFLWNFNIWAFVWALIFILVLVLTVVLARNLIRLFFEFQSRHTGYRIKSKLVLTFMIFSLFPALIMAFLAFGLINQSLETWVSAPSEQLLDSALEVSERYYEEKKENMLAQARWLAAEKVPDSDREDGWEEFAREARRAGFSQIEVIGRDSLRFQRGDPIEPRTRNRLAARARESDAAYTLEQRVNLKPGMVDRGLVAVPAGDSAGRPLVLLLGFTTEGSVAYQAARVDEANDVYAGLKGALASLKMTYVLVLAMTTLAVVFGFVWLGNYIAKRLTVPLEALAEGSRELAEGNLDHRVEVEAVDELAVVVRAFNQMAGELRESRRELENALAELRTTNVHLDERRRYIETVLQNVATGVLTMDEHGIVRTANAAALQMLQKEEKETIGRPAEQVTDTTLASEFQSMKRQALLFGSCRRQLTMERQEDRLYVATTMTTNHHSSPSGEDEVEYLIVLDDLTELIRAEKFAAWQEVARRLAHEIKNPLTPIQLSAERIQRRFEKIAPTLIESPQLKAYREVLDDATRIIADESRILKNLLSEFSRFARMPICRPREVQLHLLINRTLERYNGSRRSVEITTRFDYSIAKIVADPEQLQRVLINLIDNSLQALSEKSDGRMLEIETHYRKDRNSVLIVVSDNGHGIAAEDHDHLFLPYFSTKKKGTGLGLAIVRQIVSEHNGFVRAEPNQPEGTRVLVELPVHGPAESLAS